MKRENLMTVISDTNRQMSIDVLCIVQGLEFNVENLKVLEVYSNEIDEENFDALINMNDEEFIIYSISVDDRRIKFESDKFECVSK